MINYYGRDIVRYKIWSASALALIAYLLATTVIFVNETEFIIVTEFGRPVKTIQQAGLSFKFPDPIQTTVSLDKRLQLLNLEPNEFVTRDRRNIVVSAFVIWKIINPDRFLIGVRNMDIAKQRLESLVNSEIGTALANRPLNDFFTVDESNDKLTNIFSHISESSTRIALQELGIEILAVNANRFGFPKQNLFSIYKRMESERDRIAKQFRAQGHEEAAKIKAQTEREIRQLQAQAYREAQIVKGNSEAEAAKIYAEAFETNSEFYTFTRSMEAYKKIVNTETTFVLSTDSPIFDHLFTPPGNKIP